MAVDGTKRCRLQVNSATHESLREIARLTGMPMTRIVERAVEHYRHETMLRAHNEVWSDLATTDPDAIAAFEAEDAMWDRSTGDRPT
jgi:hypothetical protein